MKIDGVKCPHCDKVQQVEVAPVNYARDEHWCIECGCQFFTYVHIDAKNN